MVEASLINSALLSLGHIRFIIFSSSYVILIFFLSFPPHFFLLKKKKRKKNLHHPNYNLNYHLSSPFFLMTCHIMEIDFPNIIIHNKYYKWVIR